MCWEPRGGCGRSPKPHAPTWLTGPRPPGGKEGSVPSCLPSISSSALSVSPLCPGYMTVGQKPSLETASRNDPEISVSRSAGTRSCRLLPSYRVPLLEPMRPRAPISGQPGHRVWCSGSPVSQAPLSSWIQGGPFAATSLEVKVLRVIRDKPLHIQHPCPCICCV